MARLYYPPTELIVATGSGTPAALTLSPAAEFTVWSAMTGGSQLTDLKAADGTTNLPVNGSGNPFADSNGWPPGLWGPDGVVGVLWRQVGSQRSPMAPWNDADDLLKNGARKNAANTFTGAVSFTSGTAVAFTTTPTVAGQTVVTAANLATLVSAPAVQIAIKNITGEPWTININESTGVWPNGGARVAPDGSSLAALTADLYWNSQGYIGALKPVGLIDGDFWDERLA